MLIIPYWAHQKVDFSQNCWLKIAKNTFFAGTMYLKHVFGEKQFVSSNLLNMKKIWGGKE